MQAFRAIEVWDNLTQIEKMTANNVKTERLLTFSQAQGLEPLPQPFKLGELPQEVRLKIHAAFSRSFDASCETYNTKWIKNTWETITQDIYVELMLRPLNQYIGKASDWEKHIETIILIGSYNKVFDFILFVLRHEKCPKDLFPKIKKIFEESKLAYRLTHNPIEIIPISSEEEGESIVLAIEATSVPQFSGARTHLIKAGEEINREAFEDSIRSSIHAVESVAVTIDGNDKKTLDGAIKSLSKKMDIHGSLKEGMLKLYGYTNDERGIRHSLIDEDARPDLTDAMFMFGACASFVTYLINKARSAGLLSDQQ